MAWLRAQLTLAAVMGVFAATGLALLEVPYFYVIALIAGLLGFTDIAGASAAIARVLFFISVVVFLIFLAIALFVGKKIL